MRPTPIPSWEGEKLLILKPPEKMRVVGSFWGGGDSFSSDLVPSKLPHSPVNKLNETLSHTHTHTLTWFRKQSRWEEVRVLWEWDITGCGGESDRTILYTCSNMS